MTGHVLSYRHGWSLLRVHIHVLNTQRHGRMGHVPSYRHGWNLQNVHIHVLFCLNQLWNHNLEHELYCYTHESQIHVNLHGHSHGFCMYLHGHNPWRHGSLWCGHLSIHGIQGPHGRRGHGLQAQHDRRGYGQ